MTLTAQVGVSLQHKYTSALDLRTLVDELATAYSDAFTDGTGASQANRLFADTRTLADGADESLDLAGGLTDAFGTTITLAKLKALVIINPSATQTLTVGNAADPILLFGTAAHTVNIPPGGKLMMDWPGTGWTVTGGSADKLKIVNSAGAAVDYTIWLIGATA
jgi:hypothetical protein